MNSYRKMQYLIVLACLVLLLAGCGPGQMLGPTLTPTPEPTPTLTAGEQARALAEAGVTRNADWTPYVEEIDGVKMALVPAGCFMMGSTDAQVEAAFQQCEQAGFCEREWFEDEQPAHEVCFEEPFWIDVYEVTQAQFAELGGESGHASHFTGDNLPRESITWMEADAFCRKRNARLSTEAEWEYAARGPDGLVYPWGNDFVADNVVYYADYATWDVGSKPGGISWIGAYDLSGNVWEWVNDWYSETYFGTLADGVVNPQGPGSGTYRVLRGGSWSNRDYRARAAGRAGDFPDFRYFSHGLRCGGAVKTPVPDSLPTPTPTPLPTPTALPTLTASAQQARQLAKSGVTRNADWTPYVEEIDGVKMALVPAGCFMMGSTDAQVEAAFQQCGPVGFCERKWFEDEQPAHEVCFEEPFWIDVYEVTQAQFAELGGEAELASLFTGDDLPRENIFWTEADAFCKLRGLRLLTEAEWEYAARGPDSLVYPWGNDFVANNVVYGRNSGSHIWEVGSKPGGISWIGAYDLSGNVWEWVNDWYSETYFGTLADGVVNPQGPGSGTYHVLRSGSWDASGSSQRAADRSGHNPIYWNNFGLRCGGTVPVLGE